MRLKNGANSDFFRIPPYNIGEEAAAWSALPAQGRTRDDFVSWCFLPLASRQLWLLLATDSFQYQLVPQSRLKR
jgi:hypothetical protein